MAGGLLAFLAVLALGYRTIRYSPATPDAIWAKAQEDLKAGRYERATAALAGLGRMRAPTPSDWFLRGQLARARNQPDEAVACLSRIPDNHPMAPRARLLAGQIERERDRMGLAEVAFRAAVTLDPALVQAHRELIYIYGMQLRRGEIHREFLALQALTRLAYDEVYNWCALLNNLWEPSDVVEDLVRFVGADAGDRWSRLALAGILRRMGLHGQSERVLAPLPSEDPDANVIRIEIAIDRQETDLANQLLGKGASDDPRLARFRGRDALLRRDAQAAERYFGIAFAAYPNDHETLFGLQTALELAGKAEQATAIREAARSLDRLNTLLQRARAGEVQQNPSMLREMGTTCASLHRTDEARAWLELAIARNPLDGAAQQALFRVKAARSEVLRSRPRHR
jgi:tetratricopeptide (TPR) repeat protein